ncbi:MAG: hypothetical protein SXV54_19395 [Chloroflexota bacterium]|nr:hypothetical protein [Chloroflexota bacterium]
MAELIDPDDEVLDHLARELVFAHGSPRMIRAELEMLLEDAGEVELDIQREYIEREVLPDEERVSTRIGNFGEVLAASVLIAFEGFWLPIYKLRFREKRNWAVRLTDLCLIKVDNLPRPMVCYGEAKTKSTGCNLQLAVKGHESLAKDDALANPEILHFICTWLYETGMYDEARFISQIRLGKLAYDKRHDLFMVHNKESWREEILDNLEDCQLDERLVDFSVKVVLITDLRQVIDKAYARAWLTAGEILDG